MIGLGRYSGFRTLDEGFAHVKLDEQFNNVQPYVTSASHASIFALEVKVRGPKEKREYFVRGDRVFVAGLNREPTVLCVELNDEGACGVIAADATLSEPHMKIGKKGALQFTAGPDGGVVFVDHVRVDAKRVELWPGRHLLGLTIGGSRVDRIVEIEPGTTLDLR